MEKKLIDYDLNSGGLLMERGTGMLLTEKHGYLKGMEFFGIKQEVLKHAEERIQATYQQGKHTYRQCFYECFHETQKNYMKYGKSPQTLADIENCNRIFVLADDLPYETFADKYIEDLSAQEVKQLKRNIEKYNADVKRPTKIKSKGELSHKRLNNIFCWIDLVFKYAYDNGYVNRELIDNIRLSAFQGLTETNKYVKRNFFTENEFMKFDKAFDEYSDQIFALNFKKIKKELNDKIELSEYIIFKRLLFKSFFYAAFYTGLRKNELRGLRWSNLIDPDITALYSVKVEKQFSDKCTAFVNKRDHTRKPKTKSSIRICYLHTKCYETLNQLRLFLISRHLFESDEYIFYDYYISTPKPIPSTNLDRHFDKILSKAKIIENSPTFNGEERNITIHGMRHAACTMLLEKGMPMEDVARFLGHKNTKMVEYVYREFINANELDEERIKEGAKYFKS